MNVNFKESTASDRVTEEIPKRETTFYLGSDSENDETEIKSVLKKDISLSQDEPESMNYSISEKSESKNCQNSRQIRFSLTEEETNEEALTKQKPESSSSLDSSSSESESESSRSSTSSASVLSEKSKSIFITKDLFGSELSDEESDSQENKSIDVSNIQEQFAKVQQKEAEENEKLENKIQASISQCMDNVINLFIDDITEESIMNQFILQDLLTKIFEEEICSEDGRTAKVLKSICSTCIQEEKIEQQKIEKNIRDEIKCKLEQEICENIFDEKFNQLIFECCERVIAEARTEQIESIYRLIVDQVCKENIEKCFIELVFDDMTCVPKPFIEKLEIKIERDVELRSNKRRFPADFMPPEDKGKRSRRDSANSESSWKSSFIGEDSDKKTLEECKIFIFSYINISKILSLQLIH